MRPGYASGTSSARNARSRGEPETGAERRTPDNLRHATRTDGNNAPTFGKGNCDATGKTTAAARFAGLESMDRLTIGAPAPENGLGFASMAELMAGSWFAACGLRLAVRGSWLVAPEMDRSWNGRDAHFPSYYSGK